MPDFVPTSNCRLLLAGVLVFASAGAPAAHAAELPDTLVVMEDIGYQISNARACGIPESQMQGFVRYHAMARNFYAAAEWMRAQGVPLQSGFPTVLEFDKAYADGSSRSLLSPRPTDASCRTLKARWPSWDRKIGAGTDQIRTAMTVDKRLQGAPASAALAEPAPKAP